MKTEESNGIILSKETINRVAKEIVASQSFDFCSFTESKNKTSLKEFNCIYDRLTLLIYEHDFQMNLKYCYTKISLSLLKSNLIKKT